MRTSLRTGLTVLVVVVIGIVAGCAPNVVPKEERTVSMLMEANVTETAFDVVPLTWDAERNTLTSSNVNILHSNSPADVAKLYWSAASQSKPVYIAQQWGINGNLSFSTTIPQNELEICTPPAEMQYQYGMGAPARPPFVRWYAAESGSFLTTQGEILASSSQTTLDGTIMTVTEKSAGQMPDPKTLTLSVAVPSGLTHMVVLYGSGSTEKGFVCVEASPANTPRNTPDSIWLLHMNDGAGSWVDCGDLSAFNGNIFSDQTASFARVGSLLYFTHGQGKIGCIDTAAASPSIAVPEKINALLAKLWNSGPQNAGYPIQARLASDNGMLIITYPDAGWLGSYDYAVDASGTFLGSLYENNDSIVSFDARGKQGSSIPASGSVSFPSIDIFQIFFN